MATAPVQYCSIARTLDLIGDRWSLLIVREAAQGRTRFSQFHDALGIARDVLVRRLNELVEAGVLLRTPYKVAGSRTREQYELTESGRELLVILAALGSWGERNAPIAAESYLVFEEAASGRPVDLRFIGNGDRIVALEDVALVRNPEFVPLP